MPNIKRRFADDDPSSDDNDDDNDDEEEEEDEEEVPVYRGVGKGMRFPGGKGMGKQLRPPPNMDDDDDDDDDSSEDDDDDEDEEEDEPAVHVVQRGGGKQLRPTGGKQLRAPPPHEDSDDDDDDDDDDDEEEEEEPIPVQPVVRGSGKALMRVQVPDDDDDDDDDSDDSDEPQTVSRPSMGGGKQLRPPGGGKQLRPPPGGGKQLRAPIQSDNEEDDEEDNDEEEPEPQVVAPPPSGGKTLRPLGGGKQLRAPAPESDEDDEDDDDDDADEEQQIAAPDEANSDDDSDFGDQAAKPKPDASAQKVTKPPPPPKAGGKQLRRQVKEESDDDDDMDIDSDKEEAPQELPPPKPMPTRRGRSSNKAEAVVQESDDDDSNSDEEMEMDMETFDTQRLVTGDEDQKYLDSLPEIEREAILAERFEKRKAEMDMKKALRETKKQEKAAAEAAASAGMGGAKKRKAAAAKKAPAAAKKKSKTAKEKDPDDDDDDDYDEEDDEALAKSLAGKRESARNKDAKGTKAQKAKALAALREERKRVVRKEESESESDFDDDDEDSDDDYPDENKPWQQKAPTNRRTSSRLDQALSDNDDGDDDDDIKEEEEEVSAIEAGRAVVEADAEDYQKITLPRRRLGRWCNEPYFKDAVVNCFVKLFIGENDQGKRCYRLCKIVGIKTSKSYQLPPVKNHKAVTTDKMLTLKFGKNQREFPISLVSDAKVDETDVKQYVDATRGNRERTLGKKEANKMRKRQDKLVNDYVYTTADIESNLRNKKKKGESAANLALERTRAAIAVQAARAALKDSTFQLSIAKRENNLEDINDFTKAVEAAQAALDDKLSEEQTVRDRARDRKMRLAGRSKDQKWAEVNKRALQINQKVDRGEMVAKGAEGEDSAAKQSFNPYARRKVKPKILWEVGQKDDATGGDGEKEGDKAAADKAGKIGDKEQIDPNTSLIQEHQRKTAAALSQSHQFAIDEEVLAQSSFAAGIAGLGPKKAIPHRVRKGLSLSEYQEKKAAGTL